MYLEKSRGCGLRIGVALCRPCAPHTLGPSPISGECRTLFREPLQFIVIAVMSVMSGTFPNTYGVFYMTVG
jgi:hypothetical protein